MTSHRRPVVRHAVIVAIVVSVCTVSSPGSFAGSSAADRQASRPRARGTAPTSEVLTHSPLVPCPGARAASGGRRQPLRVATWNIQAALSAPPDQIAAELRSMQADVIGLQEVDVGVRRSGFTDQPRALAAALGAHHVFAASIKWDGGDYGLAVVSRSPLVTVQRHRLEQTQYGEPRIVLEVTVCANGRPLRVFNHHAAIGSRARESGFTRLRELVAPHLGRGVVVLGDFNEGPTGPGMQTLLDAGLLDLGAEQNAPTAGGGRIDYLLADGLLAKRVKSTRVWPTRKSDHHAVVTEFEW
jgi:endonuclease/exonuclease/phosphatase family metal-dependent hydrolase